MAKAPSFKAEPWTGLEKLGWSIFEDDFINNKIVGKINQKTEKSGVAYKQTVSLGKDGAFAKYANEVKLWFPYKKHTFYFRVKDNQWKLHVDHGSHEKSGYTFNCYSSVQGGRGFGSENIKLGFSTSHDNTSCDWRVSYNPSVKGAAVYNKISWKQNKWGLWLVNSANPLAKTWIQSAWQIAHTDDCGSFYLRAIAGREWAPVNPLGFLNNITADYIYNYNDNNKLGVEAQINVLGEDKLSEVAGVWEHKCATQKNTGIKVKADLKRNVNVAVKNNIEGYGSYVFGINVADLGVTNRFSYGLQVELNF